MINRDPMYFFPVQSVQMVHSIENIWPTLIKQDIIKQDIIKQNIIKQDIISLVMDK